MFRGRAGTPYLPARSILKTYVTGLLNNGCLFKSVNYGGERGAYYSTPLSSFTPKEDGNLVRLG